LAPGFLDNVEYLAVPYENFTAKVPFEHNEIPAVFFVHEAKPTLNDSSISNKVLTKDNSVSRPRSYSATHCLARLVAKTYKFPRATVEAYTDKKLGFNETMAELLRFLRTNGLGSYSDVAVNATTSYSNCNISGIISAQRIEDLEAPEKILAILAEHKGDELKVLDSPDYRGSGLSAFVRSRILQSSRKDALKLVAEYFDHKKNV